MNDGSFNIFMEGDELKTHKKLYERRALSEYDSKGGMNIKWDGANVEDIEVSDNHMRIHMDCAGVFITVRVPLTFSLKTMIARELKEEIDTLKKLNMISTTHNYSVAELQR